MSDTMDSMVYIDVGGTKIAAWKRDLGGELRRVMLRKFSPGEVAAVIASLKQSYKGEPLIIGMRGVWTQSEREAARDRFDLGKNDQIMSDIELAHELAFGGGAGIVLNAGTGSIAYGRNESGKTARAGGLGPLLGDEGSAFWIGREFLRRVEGKRAEFSELRSLAVRPDAIPAIAAFADRCVRMANRGNPEAKKIVAEAQNALVELVSEVKSRLGAKRLPLALRGGLFTNKTFAEGFSRQLHRAGYRAAP